MRVELELGVVQRRESREVERHRTQNHTELWRSATISVGRLKNNSYVASIQLNPLALMTSYQDKSTISNNSIASHSAHFFTSYTLTMAASLTLMPKLNSIGANGELAWVPIYLC